jgi:LacI family transcriptional regulator
MAQVKEIAEIAQVSPSTVSRVINNPDLVKVETKEKVYAAMRQLGYNPLKSEAATRKHIIGVAIPDITLDSNSEFVRAIEYELEKTEYDLLLINMRRSRNILNFFQQRPGFRRKIDGLIIISAPLDDECAEFFRSMELPVVLLQNRCRRERSISTNNYLGALDAVTFLIERGYRKIAFVGWEPEDERVLDRYNGYKNALERAGLYDGSDNLSAYAKLSKMGGYAATAELYEKAAPDAVFYACDTLAFGGYQYFKEQKIVIPDDVGIVGFDDLDMASVIELTTMQQFLGVKAEMAVSYLLSRLSGETPEPLEEEFCVTPRLITRGSTK